MTWDMVVSKILPTVIAFAMGVNNAIINDKLLFE